MPSVLPALAAALLLFAPAVAQADAGTWTLEFLTAGAAAGAVCLDGSAGAYYSRAPLNATASEGFIIYFEGGGAFQEEHPGFDKKKSTTSLPANSFHPAPPPQVGARRSKTATSAR